MDHAGQSNIGLLILAPFIILLVVVFVAIKFADCSVGRWEQMRSSLKARFIRRHKRKDSDPSSQSSQNSTDSDGGGELSRDLDSAPDLQV